MCIPWGSSMVLLTGANLEQAQLLAGRDEQGRRNLALR